jgi:serine O-acetyltransferase
VLLSCELSTLYGYVGSLVEREFPDGAVHDVRPLVDRVLERIEYCFANVVLPGYKRGNDVYFNHLHGDQSAVFWYYASNTAYAEFEDETLAAKFMLLNKARNGIVVTYSTKLPDRMLLIHTVGSMLGKATYGDYFVATQNVTVGTQRGKMPHFGEGVILYPGSSVIGDCRIGDGARISIGTVVLDSDVPPNCVAGGSSAKPVIKESGRNGLLDYFAVAT